MFRKATSEDLLNAIKSDQSRRGAARKLRSALSDRFSDKSARKSQELNQAVTAAIDAQNPHFFDGLAKLKLLNADILQKACRGAILQHNAPFLKHLCLLAKAMPISRVQQVKLLNDIFIMQRTDQLSNAQTEKLILAVIQNLPYPQLRNQTLLTQMAAELYWKFPQYRNLFTKDLDAFSKLIITKFTTELLSREDAQKAVEILGRYQAHPDVLATLIVRLGDINLAKQHIEFLLLTQQGNLYHVASANTPVIPDQSANNKARLYFQAIGATLIEDQQALTTTLKQCDSDTLTELNRFFEQHAHGDPNNKGPFDFYFDTKKAAGVRSIANPPQTPPSKEPIPVLTKPPAEPLKNLLRDPANKDKDKPKQTHSVQFFGLPPLPGSNSIESAPKTVVVLHPSNKKSSPK